MKRTQLFFLLSVTLATGMAGVVACSTDNTVDLADAGNDSGSDTGRADVGTDTGLADTGPAETGPIPYDSGPPLPDAGPLDDASTAVYEETVAMAICDSLSRCCFGDAGLVQDAAVDGGFYNKNDCLRIYRDLGFESSSVGLLERPTNFVVDKAKADDCLAKVGALSCNLGGAELQAARDRCFSAVQGKGAVGDACKNSIDCSDGNFCVPTKADGGNTGTCAALRKQGENCSVVDTGVDTADSISSEIACSQRGGGNSGLHCDSYDPATGLYRARADWTCQPNVANGAGCNTTVWCASGLCDPDNNYVCTPALTYFNTVVCSAEVTK